MVPMDYDSNDYYPRVTVRRDSGSVVLSDVGLFKPFEPDADFIMAPTYAFSPDGRWAAVSVLIENPCEPGNKVLGSYLVSLDGGSSTGSQGMGWRLHRELRRLC